MADQGDGVFRLVTEKPWRHRPSTLQPSHPMPLKDSAKSRVILGITLLGLGVVAGTLSQFDDRMQAAIRR